MPRLRETTGFITSTIDRWSFAPHRHLVRWWIGCWVCPFRDFNPTHVSHPRFAAPLDSLLYIFYLHGENVSNAVLPSMTSLVNACQAWPQCWSLKLHLCSISCASSCREGSVSSTELTVKNYMEYPPNPWSITNLKKVSGPYNWCLLALQTYRLRQWHWPSSASPGTKENHCL
jgi:hypothetical protein